VIFDAQVEEDLDRIVQTVKDTGYRVLWVGSTGLARCIPQLLSPKTIAPPQVEHRCTARQVMVVSGSVSEITHKQLDMLRTVPGVIMVEMNPREIIADQATAEMEIERCCSQVVNGLNDGKDVALHIHSSRGEVAITKAKGREIGLDETQVSKRVAQALAGVTKQAIDEHDSCGLVLTGGDTARTVCAKLGAKGIELLKEVEAGIPLGRLVGTQLFVITKAGGFGSPISLINSLTTLKRT
jgi:uncharacterized protein YgbK (DUF1537 family)